LTSGIASATVFGGLAAQLLTWRVAFLVSALLAALLAVLVRALPESPRGRSNGSVLDQARRPAWMVLVVGGLAFVEGAVIFGSLTFIAASLQRRGVGPAIAGSAAAAFGLAHVVSTPLVMVRPRALQRGRHEDLLDESRTALPRGVAGGRPCRRVLGGYGDGVRSHAIVHGREPPRSPDGRAPAR
jgi:MFS family permease